MLFLCQLFPWLAGGLLGWLLSGWLARRLKYGEPPVEKIVEKTVEVEKVVDNPKHLSLISNLENENRQIGELRARITAFEKSEAEMAELIAKEGGSTSGGLRSQFTHLVSGFRSKITDHENRQAEVVEKEVEVQVDNPEHLRRIKQLEEENLKIGQLRSTISDLEGKLEASVKDASATAEAENAGYLTRIKLLEEENREIVDLRSTIAQLEAREPETVEKLVEKPIDNPAHLSRIAFLETELANSQAGVDIDLSAARAAGISIKSENDFTAIEGIGPKINTLLHDDGIATFGELSETRTERIQKVLDNAGSNFQMANPGTWPDQAHLAASNRWSALKALQDILDGGVYPDFSADKQTSLKLYASEAETIKQLEAELKVYRLAESMKDSVADIEKAKAAGFKIKRQGSRDDFTVIEGIGPKIDELIHNAEIHTYSQLAKTKITEVQVILDEAGPNFALADPSTWPAQADLAAKNQWVDLMKWQDELDGGKA